MSERKEIRAAYFEGERPLFGSQNVKIYDTVFGEGESPLKESRGLYLENVLFQWKYPLWYCKDVTVRDCTWYDMARAGIWYTEHLTMENTTIEAPKNFRRAKHIALSNVFFPNAEETMWNCSDVKMDTVSAKGDYFAMGCADMEIDQLHLVGNYSFDGARNVTIRNSRILSKDAFWNSENITVYDSFISGEYLGWNSSNLTLINCTIESLQGMCYIDNLVMRGCKLINTTLAFEYANIDAQIDSRIESVMNPKSGTITAEEIGELILQKDRIDPSKTKVICNRIEKTSDVAPK